MAKIAFSVPDQVAALLLEVCRELGLPADTASACVKHLLYRLLASGALRSLRG